MFILNPYDHYLQKTNKKTSISGVALPKPLSKSTNNFQAINMSRRLMDSITRGRKAFPIVSITTASGSNPSAGVGAGQNCIPFPSLPVPISVPGKHIQSPTHHEVDHGVVCIDSQATTEWTFDIHTVSPGLTARAQFQSRLAESSRLPISGPGKLPVRKRLGSGTQVSKPNDDPKKILQETSQCRRVVKKEKSGEGGRKRGKAGKKKVTPDMKFLVAFYTSITRWIEYAENTAGANNKNFDADELAQDKLLAQKILPFLVGRGYNLLNLSSSMGFEQPSLSIEIPIIDHDPCAPIPFPLRPSRATTSPTDSSSSASPPGILTMSQIVASLILRHRERASASRLRPAPGQIPSRCRASVVPNRKSPLSNMFTAEV